jgi:hypothetical protein
MPPAKKVRTPGSYGDALQGNEKVKVTPKTVTPKKVGASSSSGRRGSSLSAGINILRRICWRP